MTFLFGAPPGQQGIGLGRLRVLLALSTIAFGPAWLGLFRESEDHRFASLTHKAQDPENEKDPARQRQNSVKDRIQSPVLVIIWAGIFAQIVIFAVCVARLSGQTSIRAAEFCGFPNVSMTPAVVTAWCLLSLILPWFMPLMPFFMVWAWKTDPVTSWRQHVRNKKITGLIGKVTYLGYTSALCGLTERFLREDPTSLISGNQEQQWTFGQILSMVLLFPIFTGIVKHWGKMPWYPIPEFQPSHSRLTLYSHLLLNCISSFSRLIIDHGRWANLRKFIRLSDTTFLYKEHALWIDAATSSSERNQRRKTICKIRGEIRAFIEANHKSNGSTHDVVDLEEQVIKPSSLLYMDSALHVLNPEEPVHIIRKVKSFPCMTFPNPAKISTQSK